MAGEGPLQDDHAHLHRGFFAACGEVLIQGGACTSGATVVPNHPQQKAHSHNLPLKRFIDVSTFAMVRASAVRVRHAPPRIA